MKKILRDLIEEDIDKILFDKEINKKSFFFLIIHYLLECKSINLNEVNNLSIELTEKYEGFLKDFDLELLKSNGEIIKVLKSALPKFNYKMADILEKIEKIKKNDHSKNYFK